MEYDRDKVDEITMALLHLVTSRTPEGGRAWRGFDAQTLERLHQRGWIGDPRTKDMSIKITAEGVKRAQEFFEKYCRTAGSGHRMDKA